MCGVGIDVSAPAAAAPAVSAPVIALRDDREDFASLVARVAHDRQITLAASTKLCAVALPVLAERWATTVR